MELYRYPISNFRNSIAFDKFHVCKHIMQYSRYHSWFHSYFLSGIMRAPKECCRTSKWEYKCTRRKYKCIATTLKLKNSPETIVNNNGKAQKLLKVLWRVRWMCNPHRFYILYCRAIYIALLFVRRWCRTMLTTEN